jgi:toxin ParE1/3/4
MGKYKLSNRAVDDLAKIWDYTFDEWSEKQADKYYQLLLASCQDLADNPNFGKNYEIGIENIFGYKSNEHIIFFTESKKNEIEIVRILHAMMDLKKKFQ